MFRETLLESAPFNRNRKRWPMALAVILESVICAGLVALPLLSTGIISVAAHPPDIVPLEKPPIPKRPERVSTSGGGGATTSAAMVVNLATNRGICLHCPLPEIDDIHEPPGLPFGISSNSNLPAGLTACSNCRGPEGPKRIISNLAPGSLIYRVEPVYPRIAKITGVRGIVKLHAVIATDGTIQSLTVVEGPPALVAAARDAVSQWRYRPYILNGHPVEVETVIVVNFRTAD